MSLADELATVDATGHAELIRTGKISALEAVDAAIERTERVNPAINAVAIELFERARAAAADGTDRSSQVFGGVPIMMKDTIPVKGEPRYRASRFLQKLNWIEDHDSYVAVKLREAGFISLAKANLPELAGGIDTMPKAHGPCHNPWNLEYSVGGSSGGSAAAVGAGMVPLAHGTDGGGSVRIPASVNGLVGLKPTRGRVSQGPDFSDTEGFSVTSVLTHSVHDTAAGVDAISGRCPGDPWIAPPLPRSLTAALTHDPGKLRIGVWYPNAAFPSDVHPDCLDALANAVALLEGLGHILEQDYPSALNTGWPPEIQALAVSIIGWEVDDMAAYTGTPVTEADVEPVIWQAYQLSKLVDSVTYEKCIAMVRAANRKFDEWWDAGWDLMLTPTLAVPPYKLGSTTPPAPDMPWPDIQPWIPFTPPSNFSGTPAITLPLHWNADGLPIGIQLGAALGREDLLVSVAAQLEQAAPWADRWAPHSYVMETRS